jgi:hypothetical protein
MNTSNQIPRYEHRQGREWWQIGVLFTVAALLSLTTFGCGSAPESSSDGKEAQPGIVEEPTNTIAATQLKTGMLSYSLNDSGDGLGRIFRQVEFQPTDDKSTSVCDFYIIELTRLLNENDLTTLKITVDNQPNTELHLTLAGETYVCTLGDYQGIINRALLEP